MHSFEVHSNESACRKKVRLGLEQVKDDTSHTNQDDSIENVKSMKKPNDDD